MPIIGGLAQISFDPPWSGTPTLSITPYWKNNDGLDARISEIQTGVSTNIF